MCASVAPDDIHFGPYVLVVNHSRRVARLLNDALACWYFSNPRIATRARLLVVSNPDGDDEELSGDEAATHQWPDPFHGKADFPPEWFSRQDGPFDDPVPCYARIVVDLDDPHELDPLKKFADKITLALVFLAEGNAPNEQDMLLLIHRLGNMLPRTMIVVECRYRRTVPMAIATGAHEAFSQEGVEYDALQSEILQSPATNFLQELIVPGESVGPYRNSKLCVHNLAIDHREQVVIDADNSSRLSKLTEKHEVVILGYYLRKGAHTQYERVGRSATVTLKAGDSVVMLCTEDRKFRDFSDALVSGREPFLREVN